MFKKNRYFKYFNILSALLIFCGIILYVNVKNHNERMKVKEVRFDVELMDRLDSYTISYIRIYGYPDYVLSGDYHIPKMEDSFEEVDTQSADLVLVWPGLRPNENSLVSIIIFVKELEDNTLEHLRSYESTRDNIKRSDFEKRK